MKLPQNIIDALIATEDDAIVTMQELTGVYFKGIYYLGRKGGASTITQQLARQLFVVVSFSK